MSLWRLVQGIAPELVIEVVAPTVDAVAKDHIFVPSVRPVQCLERLQVTGTVAGLGLGRPAPLVEVLPTPGQVQLILVQVNPAVQAVLRDDHLEIAEFGLEVFQVMMLKATDVVLQVSVRENLLFVCACPFTLDPFPVGLEVLVQQQDMLGPGTVVQIVIVGLLQYGLDTVFFFIFIFTFSQTLFPKSCGGGSGIGEGKQATAVDEISRSRWFYQIHPLHFVLAEKYQFIVGGAQYFVDHNPVVHAVGQLCLDVVQFRSRRQNQVMVELGCLFGTSHDLGLHPIIVKEDAPNYFGLLKLAVVLNIFDW